MSLLKEEERLSNIEENSFGKRKEKSRGTGRDNSFRSGQKSPEFARVPDHELRKRKESKGENSYNDRKRDSHDSYSLKEKIENSLKKSPREREYYDDEKLDDSRVKILEDEIENMKFEYEKKIENLVHNIQLLEEGDENLKELSEKYKFDARKKDEEIEDLKREIEKRDFKIEDLEKEIRYVEKDVEQKNREISVLKDNNRTLEIESEKLNEENNELIGELEKLAHKKKKGKIDKNEILKYVKDKENSGLKSQIKQEKEKNEILKEELKILKDELRKISLDQRNNHRDRRKLEKTHTSIDEDSKEELIKMVNGHNILLDEGSFSKDIEEEQEHPPIQSKLKNISKKLIGTLLLKNATDKKESVKEDRSERKYKLKRDWLDFDVKQAIKTPNQQEERKSNYDIMGINRKLLVRSSSDLVIEKKNFDKPKTIFNTPASYLVQSRYKNRLEINMSSERKSHEINSKGNFLQEFYNRKEKMSPLISSSTQEKTSGLHEKEIYKSNIYGKRSMIRGSKKLKDPSQIYLSAINEIEQNIAHGISKPYATHRGTKSLYMADRGRNSKLDFLSKFTKEKSFEKNPDEFKHKSQYRTSTLEGDDGLDFVNEKSTKKFLNEFQKKLDGILGKGKRF